jgi:hypothetical protein
MDIALSFHNKENPLRVDNVERVCNELKEELHNNRIQFYNWNAYLKYSPYRFLPIYLPFCWSKKIQTPNFLTVMSGDGTLAKHNG